MDNRQPQTRKWLPISWKVMVGYGILNIFFAILVPLQSYFALPNQPMFVFGAGDERFTGLSWNQIMALSPELGRWIVLTMVSMCAMMMGGGILIVALARNPYRKGERWAWQSLALATLVPIGYYLLISPVHWPKGLPFWVLPPGSSGVGADLFVAIALIWLYIGLWLPRKELVGQSK